MPDEPQAKPANAAAAAEEQPAPSADDQPASPSVTAAQAPQQAGWTLEDREVMRRRAHATYRRPTR
jgi:hypothetical protein